MTDLSTIITALPLEYITPTTFFQYNNVREKLWHKKVTQTIQIL